MFLWIADFDTYKYRLQVEVLWLLKESEAAIRQLFTADTIGCE